jgi:hypothetical protein
MSNKRRSQRWECALRGFIVLGGTAKSLPCAVHDISEHGARLKISDMTEIPDMFTLEIPRRHISEPVRVVRRSELEFGVLFVDAK